MSDPELTPKAENADKNLDTGVPTAKPVGIESTGAESAEVKHCCETQKQPCYCQKKKECSPKKPMTKAEIIMALLTGLYVFVASCQFHVMNGQLSEMGKQTEATRSQDRAWLGAKFPQVKPLSVGDRFTVNIAISNSGKTVAKDVRVGLESGILPDYKNGISAVKENFLKLFTIDNNPSQGMVYPGDDIYTYTSVDRILTQQDIDEIQSGAAGVVVLVQIRYIDRFGDPHFTRESFKYVHASAPSMVHIPESEGGAFDDAN